MKKKVNYLQLRITFDLLRRYKGVWSTQSLNVWRLFCGLGQSASARIFSRRRSRHLCMSTMSGGRRWALRLIAHSQPRDRSTRFGGRPDARGKRTQGSHPTGHRNAPTLGETALADVCRSTDGHTRNSDCDRHQREDGQRDVESRPTHYI